MQATITDLTWQS